MQLRLRHLLALPVLVGACAQHPVAVKTTSLPPLEAPAATAEKPVDLPGIHNLVTYAPGLYSGSVPEGDEGLETLQRLGIRTVLSVDGATPDVEGAQARGMRYVHLPIGYDGMERERALEIAKALHELPGPIYVHCHHGKHRSAGALGTAAVMLGLIDNEQAVARMKVSGTAPNYQGLYACAAQARPVDASVLASLPEHFPSVTQPDGLVDAMVQIDEANDELKAIEKAGWSAPKSHPDLAPVSVAGRLADLLRNSAEDQNVAAQPAEFRDWLLADAKKVEALESALARGDAPAAEMGELLKAVQQSCKECHSKYRD